jgi:hypothetical protein
LRLQIFLSGGVEDYIQAVTQKGGTACLWLLEKLLQIQAGPSLYKFAAAANLHPVLPLSTSRTVQVCARCCLRFAGVSGDIYAPPAPSIRDLQAAVSDAHGDAQAGKLRYIGTARGDIHVTGHLCKCAVEPQLCPLWRYACKTFIMGLFGGADGTAAGAEAETHPCPLCLGALQCTDGGALPSPGRNISAAVQQSRGSPQPWIPVTAASIAAIAEAVR